MSLDYKTFDISGCVTMFTYLNQVILMSIINELATWTPVGSKQALLAKPNLFHLTLSLLCDFLFSKVYDQTLFTH